MAIQTAELVNDFLNFAARRDPRLASVPLYKTVEEVQAALAPQLSAQQIRAVLDVPRELVVTADRDMLRRAILNLWMNAIDAMPAGGELVVTAHAGTSGVELEVADSGPGLPDEIRRRVFEPFFTTKEQGKGSGLGLSMVYGLVKQTGGHVKIYSEVGFGTTVKIYLPRAEAKHHADARAESVEAIAAKGHELILVVEDNEHMRAVTLKQLADLGYRTLEAANARLALSILDDHPEIDLLFTDVIMPGGITGCELAREVKKRRPDLKILLTSGYTQQAVANGCHDLEGLELLHKPFRKRDLAMKLRQTLGS